MIERNSDQPQLPAKPAKAPYSPPKLIQHGSMDRLVQTGVNSGPDGGVYS